MHVVGGGDGFLNLGNLFGTLDATLLDASQNQIHRGIGVDSARLHTQQLRELQFVVGTIRRQVMDATSVGNAFVAESLQVG